MFLLTLIVHVLILFPFQKCIQKKYHNYSLYRALPVNEKQLKFFNDLLSVYDVNFWKEPGQVNKVVEFVISPEDRLPLIKDAESLGINLIKVIEDVQKAFDKQTVKVYDRRNMNGFDWLNYFKADDIQHWLLDLAAEYPQVMHLESIGKTYQNRDILVVRIHLEGKHDRPKVIVEGGIHAREWISSSFVTYMINQLVKASSSHNSDLKEISEAYEWYFVPILNPDGYEISHTTDRMWRKNSRGVDLNRNFDIEFGTTGVSFDRWSEIYCGSTAFSELESQAMASFVRSKKNNLAYYLAFHSYGQLMILPYTYSKLRAENYDEVSGKCQKAALRIADRYGTGYTVGTSYETIGYLTSGVSGCWVKRNFKVPYVVTFELRDEGEYGFAMPPHLILPTCEETMDGLLSLLLPNKTRLSQKTKNSGSESASHLFGGKMIVWNIVLFILMRKS